mgnify:CR=1 FL=1
MSKTLNRGLVKRHRQISAEPEDGINGQLRGEFISYNKGQFKFIVLWLAGLTKGFSASAELSFRIWVKLFPKWAELSLSPCGRPSRI